ncbi:unnamed protein product [Dicrocoelium dendriticum]|nr:unnamed protein product [Dicrocoelium dendriticum]
MADIVDQLWEFYGQISQVRSTLKEDIAEIKVQVAALTKKFTDFTTSRSSCRCRSSNRQLPSQSKSPSKSPRRMSSYCWYHHFIIGVDFPQHFDLLVDVKRHRLIDQTTKLSVDGISSDAPSLSPVYTIANSPAGKALLESFPEVSRLSSSLSTAAAATPHHMVTKGPPVSVKARRLIADKPKTARAEFEHMLEVDIVRPSSSPWSLPLHMVPKKSGDWRPCGNYHALNNVTIPDRYLILHIQDITAGLHGVRVFSKIDLVRAYHQIPVADENYRNSPLLHHLD